MAKNSQRLDKSKNYNRTNHTNENQWMELQLDELEFIVGGTCPFYPDPPPPPPPPPGGDGSQGSRIPPCNQQP